ncbi:MAG: hypothetical protein EA398_10995, partial [Deltaproteobacteria bacterium]
DAREDIQSSLDHGSVSDLEGHIKYAATQGLLPGKARNTLRRHCANSSLHVLLSNEVERRDRRSAGQLLLQCALAVVTAPDGRLVRRMLHARSQLDGHSPLEVLDRLVSSPNSAMHVRAESDAQPPPVDLLQQLSLNVWLALGSAHP